MTEQSTYQLLVIGKSKRTHRLSNVLRNYAHVWVDIQDVQSDLMMRVRRRLHLSDEIDSVRSGIARLASKYQVNLIVSLDNSILYLNNLEEFGYSGNVLLIQHGTNPTFYSSAPPTPNSRVILLSFGHREVDYYFARGVRPRLIVPVGSLLQCQYLKSPNPIHIRKRQITVVSEFKLDFGGDSHADSRNSVWDFLLTELAKFRESNLVEVVVAGRPLELGGNAEQEYRYFERYLGKDFRYVLPDTPFSTYKVIDESELSIGVVSAALSEALSRGSKVLFVNSSNDASLDFAVPGVWTWSLRSQLNLSQSIAVALNTPETVWLESTRHVADYIVRNSKNTDVRVASIIDTLLSGAGLPDSHTSLFRDTVQ